MAPVVTGMAQPIEDSVNQIIDVVALIPIVGETIPPIDTNVAGLLGDAAAGDPITLQVYDTDGNPVDDDDRCNLQADTISLADEGGISIGGNRISGLGANGETAFAGDIDAVALGNGARTEVAATGSVAIGAGARVSAANSVAIGAGSTADRGPQLSYAALAIVGPQASAGEFSVGAVGAERQITNVAPGSQPTDAVNVAQLQGVVDSVDAVAGDLAALDDSAVQYDGPARDRVTLAGADGTIVDNVGEGALAPGSREAVNGSQLYATNQAVAGNTTAITNLTTRVDNIDVQITNLTTLVGSGGGGDPGPARYSDAAGTPNDGTPTDHAALVGAGAGPVVLHNVGDGDVAAGSNDAVNGGQLAATNAQVAQNTLSIVNLTNLIGTLGGGGGGVNPVQYSDAGGTPNGGVPSDDVTLVGLSGGAVAVHNVANGNVAAGSSDAVNGGQLYAVAEDVAETRAIADEAVELGRNSVQYDNAQHSSVTLGDGVTPVALHNVGAGVAATDAVNVGQFQSGMQSTLAEANAYTDQRFAMIGQDLTIMRRDLNGGIAGALAAAGMPQASDPGRSMLAAGVGVYQGQQAVAFGFSTRLRDARTVLRAGAVFDTRGRAAGNAGVGIQF